MKKNKFIIFICLCLLLPFLGESSLLNYKEPDQALIAGRSGGHGHSGRSSHRSSSRSHHSSSKSHRTGGGTHFHGGTKSGVSSQVHHGTKVVPHTPRITTYHNQSFNQPGQPLVPGVTGVTSSQLSPQIYGDQYPMPANPPPDNPPTIVVDDNVPTTTDDNTPDNTPSTDLTVQPPAITIVQVPPPAASDNTPKVITRKDIPYSIDNGLFNYCFDKYWDEDEQDPFMAQINENLIVICWDELMNKYLDMQNKQKSPSDQQSQQQKPV